MAYDRECRFKAMDEVVWTIAKALWSETHPQPELGPHTGCQAEHEIWEMAVRGALKNDVWFNHKVYAIAHYCENLISMAWMPDRETPNPKVLPLAGLDASREQPVVGGPNE